MSLSSCLLAVLVVAVSGSRLTSLLSGHGSGHGSSHGSGHGSSSCSYWCKERDAHGRSTERFYCCDDRHGTTRRPHVQIDHHVHVHDHHSDQHHHRPGGGFRPILPGLRPGRPGLGALPAGGGHRGRCPPPRPFCPRVTHKSTPPQICKGDYACDHADKCCYDVCLELKVCKPAH